MKILHINTYDTGGAGKACVRLHQGLLEQGVDSKLLLLYQSDKELMHSYQYIPPLPGNFEKIKRKASFFFKELHLSSGKDKYDKREVLQNRPEGFELFSFPDTPYNITQHPLYLEADIINLHWTAGFLDYRSFFKKTLKKIVWTLHDMNPFTGGCHYSGDCIGFEGNCFLCPQLLNSIDSNYSHKILRTKIQAIKSKTHLTVVPISKWLLNQSMKSILFSKFDHVQIPNGLDPDLFKPAVQKSSREELGLPVDKKIILFVADSLNNKRKGFALLLNAIEQLGERDDIALCVVGDSSAIQFKLKSLFELGRIVDEQLLCSVYSAADVFVIPSLEDNFPNTVLEALMCGTPVIGFPVGGIKEIIQDQHNGYLCDSADIGSLLKALNMFLDNPSRFKGEEIRKAALQRYTQKIQAEKYVELYKSISKKN